MRTAAAVLAKDPPVWDAEGKTIDFYYWYYASLALGQYDAPAGVAWTTFDKAMLRALVPSQEIDGCRVGSWDPAVDRWGSVGGRVYATAINVLTLEVYYRYGHVFTGSRERKA